MDTLIERYVHWSRRRPWWVVAAFVVLGGVSLFLAQRIEVLPNLAALLPPGRPELARLKEMSERVPASTPLNVLIAGPNPEATKHGSVAVYEAIQKWPDTLDVIRKRDPQYFLDRRLLFLPASELEYLAEDADAHVSWHECESLPGCVNIDKVAPPLPTMEDLREKFQEQAPVRALLALLGLEEVPLPEEKAHDGSPGERDGPAENSAWEAGDLCAKDGSLCVVTAVLDGSPFDLSYAEEVSGRLRVLEAKLRTETGDETLRVVPDGPYRDAPLVKEATTQDLAKVGLLASFLVLVLLVIQFRTIKALLLLVAPIVTSILVTLGIVALVHPSVNIISAVTLVVLAGLGVDFGIHLLTHYSSERSSGLDPEGAVAQTFIKLKGPLITAGITSACGFGSLMVAEFRAFSEMGGIASVGILCALLCFFALFPALAFIVDRAPADAAAMVRSFRAPSFKPPRGLLMGIVVIGVLGAVLGGVFGPRVEFEQNFRNLKPSMLGHGLSVGDALHGGTTRSETVVMANQPAQLAAALEALEADGPGDLIQDHSKPFTLGPSTFVPPNQDERLRHIEALREVHRRAEKHVPDAQKADLDRWDDLLRYDEAITPESLPGWVQTWLSERDGSFGKLGLLYTELSQAHAGDMAGLGEQIAQWEARFEGVRFASPGLLLGAVLPGLQKDIPRMLTVALIGLFLGTLIASRSLKRTAVVLAPIALATAMALAALYFLDLKVNLYNILIFPVTLGLGIDGAVYISWAMEETVTTQNPKPYLRASRAVLGSTLTTIAGFGSMVISTHPGLVSLGYLSIVLFFSILFATLLWLPALLASTPTLAKTTSSPQ